MEKFLFDESRFFSAEVVAFFKHTAFLIPNWKWLAIVISLVLAFAIRPVFQFIIKELKKHNPWTKKFTKSFSAYFLAQEVERPLAWVIVILLLFAVNDGIELSGKLANYYEHILKAIMGFHLIRIAYYAVDALGTLFSDYAAKTETTLDDKLVPFAAKALKALVVVLGFLIILQSFGLNVMSLLAGLGLGGLALALAAQDTAANLFGSVMILIDNPFQIGDWVKVGSTEGTVEEIGFRSTRIRTFYNSVVTIPNAVMAKDTIDNMGVRPARRIRQVLGLAYETSPQRIDEFCDRVRYLIKQDPKVVPDTVTVNFNNFNVSTLDVLVNFHLQVFTGPDELSHQQKIFTEILAVANEMKVEFAYPTQTVYYRGGQA